MKKLISLILFDIDGTLVLPKGAGRASTRLAMLDMFGTDAGLEGHHFGGKTDWQTLSELLAERNYSDEDFRRILPEYEQIIARHLAAIIGGFPIGPCPGALEVVNELCRQGRPLLGILTGNVSTTAPIKLKAAGFEPDWFPVGAYGSEARLRDDLPFLAVERAERWLGRRIARDEVLVVGDTPADVACARALGAVAVAVQTGFSSRDELRSAKPDYLWDDLRPLLEMV